MDSSSTYKHGDAPPPYPPYYPPGGYPPGQPLPPHHGYPPGYVPQPMPPHHGYPPGYVTPTYPNHTYQNHNPYYNATPQTYQNRGGAKAFVRGFIMCSCLMFSAFFLATLIMALVLHPQFPIYTLNSLSVANFNTTPTLTADWNISITVNNVNERLQGFFSEMKVEMTFQNDVAAMKYVPNFELDRTQEKLMNVITSSNGSALPKWDLDGMATQRDNNGSVTFDLRMSSVVMFKSNSMSTRNTLFLAVCEKLNIVFQNNTNTGVLNNGGKPILCQLYV
ncbi:hypothetical protein RJT34_19543 [Clitoria ternatea]|uniref:Late embryogenesis abundant protein LEA-2 subgroup domain-containing protein n=1 Tax=Clitoria ternatea TaxID=43366 RepID=A0AAN9IR93_CLITE